MRQERIEHKIAQIIDSVNFISDELPNSMKEFSNSIMVKNALYKQIEFAIQNVIDICSIINSDLDLGMPENEDVIFNHLEYKKIFSKKVLDIIREMKGFRNILVHKYGEIDDNKAYEDIKSGLDDFEIIIQEIERFLREHKEKEKKGKEEKNKQKNEAR